MGWSILDAGFTPNLVRIARRFTIRLIVEAHPKEFAEIAGILDGVGHATYAPKLWWGAN
jgi:hypothetical protein